MSVGRAILRVIVGALFVGHGTQKLFGWFGGSGRDATAQMMERLELRPPKAHATAAGAAEAAGGALLVAGPLTPVASTLLSSVMITAIRKVHGKKGAWNSSGGYEYNAVLLAALFALTAEGPGSYSVDGRTAACMRRGAVN
jgi:putative oxidoreductase